MIIMTLNYLILKLNYFQVASTKTTHATYIKIKSFTAIFANI